MLSSWLLLVINPELFFMSRPSEAVLGVLFDDERKKACYKFSHGESVAAPYGALMALGIKVLTPLLTCPWLEGLLWIFWSSSRKQSLKAGTHIAEVRNGGEHGAQTNFWQVQIKAGQGNSAYNPVRGPPELNLKGSDWNQQKKRNKDHWSENYLFFSPSAQLLYGNFLHIWLTYLQTTLPMCHLPQTGWAGAVHGECPTLLFSPAQSVLVTAGQADLWSPRIRCSVCLLSSPSLLACAGGSACSNRPKPLCLLACPLEQAANS